jgi:two-component system cell cycle response regulator DivK
MIKESPKSRNTPIIALTAYAMKGDEEKVREAGCDGYIAKPIDTEIFLQEVARFLNK